MEISAGTKLSKMTQLQVKDRLDVETSLAFQQQQFFILICTKLNVTSTLIIKQ